MKKVVVTGATGFVGKHVIAALSKRTDIKIIACGRDKEKLDLLSSKYSISTVKFDITETEENWYEYLGKPTILIHLAWGHLNDFNSIEHINSELHYQQKFIRNILDNGLTDITISGTCFEYGLQNGKLSEDINTQAITNYGLAKETLLRFINITPKKYSRNIKWLRYFYMYGVGQNKRSLLSLLDKAIKENESVFNMSGGEQLRDYLSVDDVARYTVMAALQTEISGVINVCSGKPISVRNLVEKRCTELHSDIELKLGFYPYPNYEPMAFWGDAKRINTILKNSIND